MNLGGWWALLTIKQREAEQQAQWLSMQEQFEADRRHQEMLEAMRRQELQRLTSYEDDEEEEEEEETPPPPAPYFGPVVDVSRLGLPDFSLASPPATFEELRSRLDPPNLLVVGGQEHLGWAVAQEVQRITGGALRWANLAGARSTDLASALNPRVEHSRDVVFFPSIEKASDDAVAALAPALEIQPSGSIQDPDGIGRWLTVTIGRGPFVARPRIDIHGVTIVAQTTTGVLPSPLSRWGAQLVVPKDTKICPQCAEEVKAAALLCRYCRFEFKEPDLVSSLWDNPQKAQYDRGPRRSVEWPTTAPVAPRDCWFCGEPAIDVFCPCEATRDRSVAVLPRGKSGSHMVGCPRCHNLVPKGTQLCGCGQALLLL